MPIESNRRPILSEKIKIRGTSLHTTLKIFPGSSRDGREASSLVLCFAGMETVNGEARISSAYVAAGSCICVWRFLGGSPPRDVVSGTTKNLGDSDI